MCLIYGYSKLETNTKVL